MATIPTPEQGKPILDFFAGTFDGSSYLFQSRNGATEHVSGDDVADYVNTSRIYNGLDTESKTPIGAINEVNEAIDEVAEEVNNPTVTVGTFTANANINLLRSTLIKVNSIKFLSVIFYVREATDTIGTMSSGFEASHNYDFTIANDNGTSTRARINQNNILSFSTATPVQGSYYALTIAYI